MYFKFRAQQEIERVKKTGVKGLGNDRTLHDTTLHSPQSSCRTSAQSPERYLPADLEESRGFLIEFPVGLTRPR